MTVKNAISKMKIRIGAYEIKIRDYKYTGKPPVLVMVTGTKPGECKNHPGEDCYFFSTAHAWTIPKVERSQNLLY